MKRGKTEENSEKKSRPKLIRIILIIILILLVLGLVIFVGIKVLREKEVGQTSQNPGVVVQNPMNNIVKTYTKDGNVDENSVVLEGIKEFNSEYINYILIAMGVNELHKSAIYGNPVVEFVIEGESWNSVVLLGGLKTTTGTVEKKDLIIKISKEEAVRALISPDIKSFMKNSVVSGKTEIVMVGGKVELFSKGYLDMYNALTK